MLNHHFRLSDNKMAFSTLPEYQGWYSRIKPHTNPARLQALVETPS